MIQVAQIGFWREADCGGVLLVVVRLLQGCQWTLVRSAESLAQSHLA